MSKTAEKAAEREGLITRNWVLGGGAGFFSKSLAYPYLGINDGLKWTSKYLDAAFNKHKHWQDEELGISPHTLKYGKYMQQLSAFGACEVMVR